MLCKVPDGYSFYVLYLYRCRFLCGIGIYRESVDAEGKENSGRIYNLLDD